MLNSILYFSRDLLKILIPVPDFEFTVPGSSDGQKTLYT